MNDDTAALELRSFNHQLRRMAQPTPGVKDRHAVPPITLVPDDVLHTIFHFVAEYSYSRIAYVPIGRERGPRDGICVVSHVCGYWRRLALNDPQLWGYIVLNPDSSLAFLQTYLERSKDAPLRIRLEGTRPTFNRNIEIDLRARLLADHVHRIVEFRAVEFRPTEMNTILKWFKGAAPRLRCLMLEADSQLLQPAVFSGNLPALRDIYVKGVSMPWQPYQDLTDLQLNDQLVPSMEKLVWTLRHCPRLKSLKLGFLDAMIRQDTGEQLCSVEPVALPRLEELFLRSHVQEDVVDLISCLRFPDTTSVSLKLLGWHRHTIVDLPKECPSLSAITSKVKGLFLELTGCDAWSASIVMTSRKPEFKLQWEWYQEGKNNEMVDFIGLSPTTFPALEALVIIATSYQLDVPHWRCILSAFPCLVYLKLDISMSMIANFWTALVPKFPRNENMLDALVVPALRYLKVERMEEQETVFNVLGECFRARANRGCRLRTLDLVMRSGRAFPPTVLDILTENIGKVNITYVRNPYSLDEGEAHRAGSSRNSSHPRREPSMSPSILRP
ncbi:predicted protein [Postia placenta Mad-698-R]|uniref:F-box domain-containing protein n=1 Tax=Postia placenta MAD-698-R-SB12 TaxID=670580 RepID=A0A1X6N5X5_9APHY|nr:hypothetical protein POSPLADRAFT_1179622 [Postia placenta MAD-698-R-SB12]EED81874.1 predicted protein [Postia placenta Mad-698-R]OSX64015.1 hypothetical protein POSPLADRAFT_1179622 [Postia placenta MAD-698-R-SB12]